MATMGGAIGTYMSIHLISLLSSLFFHFLDLEISYHTVKYDINVLKIVDDIKN